MKIKVTARHIKAGTRGSDTSCPIALAVGEAIKKTCLPKFLRYQRVTVDGDIRLGEGMVMDGTEKINDFIQKFDDGEQVKPFTFDLKF